MKISYNHLSRAFTKKISIEDMSTKLFQLGHEHTVEDEIFDIEFTPNRGDCLSLLGLSRDLGIFYDKNKNFISTFNEPIEKFNLNFVNEIKENCPKITFLNIEISGQISEYKDYLNDYFVDLNIKKNNFFTDVSNYLSYEMGQPTHCYDYEKINNNLTLKVNNEASKFKTITGQEINILEGELVFTSDGKVVNLAGVMGGENSACNNQTKNVVVECAFFKPEAIIGKTLKYNLISDAAYKFERGTDHDCHEKVLRRFIKIVNEHTSIKKLEISYFGSEITDQTQIQFSTNKINEILGTNITDAKYKDYLNRLGFKLENSITKPSYRNDIESQNDLAEDIARIIGYDNIPISRFQIKNINKIRKESSKEELIKQFLIKNGFAEVINSSFSKDEDSMAIKLDNPMDKNSKYIRSNIINSLIDNVIYNENRQHDSIKIFEISDIYTQDQKIKKEKFLGLIVVGKQGHNYKDFSKQLDLKYLTNLLGFICQKVSDHTIEIDRKSLNSKIKTPIFAFEIPLKDLSDDIPKYESSYLEKNDFIKYQPISEFPSSYRDVSISIKNFNVLNDVLDSLANFDSTILKESFIFDFFDNKKNNEIKIGYRFIFQSSSSTLTDSDIDVEVNKIVKIIKSFHSVEIPGLTSKLSK